MVARHGMRYPIDRRAPRHGAGALPGHQQPRHRQLPARIDQLTAVFSSHGDDAAMAPVQAVATIAGQMQEALVMAYSDAFMTLGVLLALPCPALGLILPN